MQFKMKKIAAVALGAVMALSTVAVSAEWKFAGYDTTDLSNIGKIYNEVIDGDYTSKQKTEAVDPEDIEWKAEGFEYDYPHMGYDRLFIEGNAQKQVKYNNTFPQWETRLKDYTWELCGDHRIWQRQQTNIPGAGWRWDYGVDKDVDANLYTPTTRFADTVDSYNVIGFADLDLNGEKISEEVADMYKNFAVYVTVEDMLNTKVDVDGDGYAEELFSPAVLSARDAWGQYVVSDEFIADYVASIQDKSVTGPSFHGEPATRNVAEEYLAVDGSTFWYWDADTVRFGGGKVTWTDCKYEMADPYAYYQFMVINGVVCDGTGDKPYIYRYTGGKAAPVIEWKYITYDEVVELDETYGTYNANWYDVIEWKHIDGKPAYDEYGYPVLRIPTGEYANTYVNVTANEIQIWRTTDNGADELLDSIDRLHPAYGGLSNVFVPGAGKYKFSN